ncbi:hypothetical protein SEVIR_3G092850v4 [Setaria viridis]
MLTWKRTALPWPQAARRTDLVRDSVGSEATPSNVNSPGRRRRGPPSSGTGTRSCCPVSAASCRDRVQFQTGACRVLTGSEQQR